jgi:hypothetical protein
MGEQGVQVRKLGSTTCKQRTHPYASRSIAPPVPGCTPVAFRTFDTSEPHLYVVEGFPLQILPTPAGMYSLSVGCAETAAATSAAATHARRRATNAFMSTARHDVVRGRPPSVRMNRLCQPNPGDDSNILSQFSHFFFFLLKDGGGCRRKIGARTQQVQQDMRRVERGGGEEARVGASRTCLQR